MIFNLQSTLAQLDGKVAHGAKDQGNLFGVVPDISGLNFELTHHDQVIASGMA